MIELDRKIGHNTVISIHELFVDRYEPSHLIDQVINYMEGIGDASAEGANGMGQLFAADLSVDGSATALSVSLYPFIHGYGCGTALSHR